MRHQKHGRKFGRQSAARHALMSSLVQALIEHERIRTTDAKAKELRRHIERTVTWATSVAPIITRGDSKKKDADDQARVVHAMRMAARVVRHKPALAKLFSEIGPRFVGRPGGYTRVLKLGHRVGDAAPMSLIEFVDYAGGATASDAPEPSEGEEAAPKKKPAKREAKAEAAPKKKAAAPKKKEEKAAPKKKAQKTDE
jgi:large subunit ribosomal protein L17